MANYLVLSLQTDEIIPTPTNLMDKVLVDEMEQRLNRSMEKFGLTRLELFRNILALIRKIGQEFVEKYSKLFQY